jgi:hypothetical protein
MLHVVRCETPKKKNNATCLAMYVQYAEMTMYIYKYYIVWAVGGETCELSGHWRVRTRADTC